MARFDVFINSGSHAGTTPYLLDVQSNHLEGLATRVVIPLRRRDKFAQVGLPLDLTPVFVMDGAEYFLDTPRLAAVPLKELGAAIGSLERYQAEIINAIDRLFGAF